ncbi:MAG: hypothetical protein JF625_30125 [Inquilinus limosus]|uniref:Uncharacterized protein n=1 Tax=Inquilinus limosus TaxID=171674 RepID=A0A952FVW3_9PROT|nr:hypothetical protein [Inquilinus limosus]
MSVKEGENQAMRRRNLGIFSMALLSASIAGCVNSEASKNAKTWIGVPAQELISQIGQPAESETSGGLLKYTYYDSATSTVQKTNDYTTLGPGPGPNGVTVYQHSDPYLEDVTYTCRNVYYIDGAGKIVDAYASGDCQ